jgi:hypothetical protein
MASYLMLTPTCQTTWCHIKEDQNINIKFYVVFAVHFDNIQQLNQQMHFIS